jgi:hypothetical protein
MCALCPTCGNRSCRWETIELETQCWYNVFKSGLDAQLLREITTFIQQRILCGKGCISILVNHAPIAKVNNRSLFDKLSILSPGTSIKSRIISRLFIC